MKSIRSLLHLCVAAILLIAPASAQAWVLDVTHGIYSSTTNDAFGFSNSLAGALAGPAASDTESYSFTIKPNSGSGAVQDVVTRINYFYGTIGTQGLQNQIGMIQGLTGSYMSPPVTVYNTAPYISGSNGFDYTFKTNTLYTLQLYNAYANPTLSGISSVAFIAGSLSVTTPDTSKTPIPGTLLLLGPGIAGLAALRKKFKA